MCRERESERERKKVLLLTDYLFFFSLLEDSGQTDTENLGFDVENINKTSKLYN